MLLGFTLAVASAKTENTLFCQMEDVETVLRHRMAKNKHMLDDALKALEAGFKSSK
jgi:hypothetical protein